MSHLINQTQSYQRQAESGIVTHDIAPRDPSLGPAQTTGIYPRKGFESRSAKDEMMREKMEFMDKDGKTPFGQVIATDSDFEWLRKKRETESKANFDAWIGRNFNVDDVTTRRWLQEVHPEYYDSREQSMIDRAKFALRVNLLKMRGPKNHKDLILLWGLQTGKISLDRNWNVIGAQVKYDQKQEQKRFAGGLLTPSRYRSDTQRTAAATYQEGTVSANPFITADTGVGGRQISSPFAVGAEVPNTKRYPAFMDNAIKPFL